MDASHREKVLINLQALHKMASTWVVAVATAVWGVWASQSDAEKALVLESIHVARWAAPYLLAALTATAWTIARTWPQHGITEAEAVAKAADVPQPPNTDIKDAP